VKLDVVAVVGGIENDERKRNVRSWCDFILNQDYPDYTVSIVEMSTDKLYYQDAISSGINYYTLKSDVFCKPWGMNYLANKTSGDVIVCSDVDVQGESDYLSMVAVRASVHVAMFGSTHCVCLNGEGSDKYRSGERDFDIYDKSNHDRVAYTHSIGAAGPINIFHRDFYYDKIGGWWEAFTRNKGSDNDIMWRSWALSAITGEYHPRDNDIYKVPIDLIHLHHNIPVSGKGVISAWQMSQRFPHYVSGKIKSVGIGGATKAKFDIDAMWDDLGESPLLDKDGRMRIDIINDRLKE